MDSDNGLSPSWQQAIIWTNAGILLIRPWGINFSTILIAFRNNIFIQEYAFENVIWKMGAILSWPQCVKYFGKKYSLMKKFDCIFCQPVIQEICPTVDIIQMPPHCSQSTSRFVGLTKSRKNTMPRFSAYQIASNSIQRGLSQITSQR